MVNGQATIVHLMVALGILSALASGHMEAEEWTTDEGIRDNQQRIMLEPTAPAASAAAAAPGNIAASNIITVVGTLQVVHMHDANGSTTNTHLLSIPGQGLKKLLSTSPLLAYLITGDHVQVTYNPADSAKVSAGGLPAIVALEIMKAGIAKSLYGAPANIASITFILSMCGQKAAASVEDVMKVWFNENSGGNYDTMQNFFGGCSLNKTQFTSATNRVVNVQLPCSGSISGMDWSANTCEIIPDVYGWAYAAEDYASSVLGINLTPYKHRILVLPLNTPCNWAGLGNLGCGDSCYVWVQGGQASSVDAFAHELGHNLFLNHAGEGADEYADFTSAMGYCCNNRCYNTPQLYQLGWTKPVADLKSATLTRIQNYNVRLCNPNRMLCC